jgi:hypothetical protein
MSTPSFDFKTSFDSASISLEGRDAHADRIKETKIT